MAVTVAEAGVGQIELDGHTCVADRTSCSTQSAATAEGGAASSDPSDTAGTPRVIEIVRGASYQQVATSATSRQESDGTSAVAAAAAAAATPPPSIPEAELPVFTEAELRRMPIERQVEIVMRATAAAAEAAAAAAATSPTAGSASSGTDTPRQETLGIINQRRRQLLAAATAGVGAEARLVFEGTSTESEVGSQGDPLISPTRSSTTVRVTRASFAMAPGSPRRG